MSTIRTASIALVLGLAVTGARADDFRSDCSLPLQIKELSTGSDVFVQCGNEGQTESAGHKLQNRQKNNLCATGNPLTISYGVFIRLQKAIQKRNIPHGGKLPEDRSSLQGIVTEKGAPLGEGTLVRFVAFLRDAHFPRGTETVNCKASRQEFKDIHIDLVRKQGDKPCNSITAEMIPHFRPAAWAEITNIDELSQPIRITGQLFFDASHQACGENPKTSPKRASIWEIHPVYAVDVCKNTSLASCRADDESQWIPLHQWVEQNPDEEPPDR